MGQVGPLCNSCVDLNKSHGIPIHADGKKVRYRFLTSYFVLYVTFFVEVIFLLLLLLVVVWLARLCNHFVFSELAFGFKIVMFRCQFQRSMIGCAMVPRFSTYWPVIIILSAYQI